MKILLTNDDGIYADGLHVLARSLAKGGHQIAIVSPDRERSAAGHSITLSEPLRAKSIVLTGIEGIESFHVSGTPADCVKLGIESLISFKPDLVIAGINHGANLGGDVLYSGTVSAAIEGWMMGHNAIAASMDIKNGKYFEENALFLQKLIVEKEELLFADRSLFNINFPDIPTSNIKGMEITFLSRSLYDDHYEKRIDPMGKEYYWLTGEIKEKPEPDTDIWAIRNNYISITPLKIDLTHREQREKLKKQLKMNK